MTIGKTIGRKVSLGVAFLLFCVGAAAQSVEFSAGAPQMVESGAAFRVEFTATTNSSDLVPSGFSGPDFTGLNVVAGPSESRGQSISIVNGSRSESHTYTYTYVVSASAEGRLTVGSATVTIGARTYTTKPLQIEVVAAGAAAQGQGGAGASSAQASGTIAKDDILVRIIPSRTSVYKGEPIRVQLKIYTRVDIAGLRNAKYPAFNGFWSQEISLNSAWEQETYNDKLYNSQVVREFLIFPQQSGTLSIEQFGLSVVARIVTQGRRQSIFDDFFGGGPSIQDIPLDLTAGPIPITVKDWPAGAPAGFQGAVGRFTLEGGPSQLDIPANSSANFDLKITGSGNLPLINAPTLEMPTSFEQYTVKTTDGYAVSGATITGNKTFSTPFIARAEGEYTLAPVEFVYFDPSDALYHTLRTPSYTLHIGADTGGGNAATGLVGGVNREDLKILSEDIRFIRLGDLNGKKIGSVFLWSWGYWLTLILILALFVCALIYLQKQIRLHNNKTLVRNRRAQKVALRRLKVAEKRMLAKDSAGFYDEMLKALWGYVSDKLNIPVAQLSRDNVREGLTAKGVDTELIDRYVAVIAECEYRQYAPSDKNQIGDVYNTAVELISKMESKI
ncbi:MAG: BatD family protein [Rikenellaceae bacterium]|nr:BatD family protein [Rikenellaceae bacterium]